MRRQQALSALLLAAETKSPSNLDRAALAQYAAKGLVFANRAKEAIPLAARATTLFEEVILTDPLAVLAAKADLALALACSGITSLSFSLSSKRFVDRSP